MNPSQEDSPQLSTHKRHVPKQQVPNNEPPPPGTNFFMTFN